MYIQGIDLLSLSHRLVEMTNCTRYFIFHCCAKIIKSGAENSHCAIQRKLLKSWVLHWVVKSITFVLVYFSSKSLEFYKTLILLISSKYKQFSESASAALLPIITALSVYFKIVISLVKLQGKCLTSTQYTRKQITQKCLFIIVLQTVTMW